VSDISIAKENCQRDPGCTGITSQVNAANGGTDVAGWEPRNNRNGYRPWTGVTSYECKRVDAPAAAPAPAPAQCPDYRVGPAVSKAVKLDVVGSSWYTRNGPAMWEQNAPPMSAGALWLWWTLGGQVTQGVADMDPVHIFSKTFVNSGAPYSTTIYGTFDNYGTVYVSGNEPSREFNNSYTHTVTIPTGTVTIAVNARNGGTASLPVNPAGFWLYFKDQSGNFIVTDTRWDYNGSTPVQQVPCSAPAPAPAPAPPAPAPAPAPAAPINYDFTPPHAPETPMTLYEARMDALSAYSPSTVPLNILQSMFVAAGCSRTLQESDVPVIFFRTLPSMGDVQIEMAKYGNATADGTATPEQSNFCQPPKYMLPKMLPDVDVRTMIGNPIVLPYILSHMDIIKKKLKKAFIQMKNESVDPMVAETMKQVYDLKNQKAMYDTKFTEQQQPYQRKAKTRAQTLQEYIFLFFYISLAIFTVAIMIYAFLEGGQSYTAAFNALFLCVGLTLAITAAILRLA